MNKKVLTFLGCICFLTSVAQISPDDMIIQMGRGLNIGNVLSAPTEGAWSPAIEQQYFIDVATAGFTNVRIPIDFYGVHTAGDTTGYSTNNGTSGSYTGSSADYVVDPAYLNRLEEIIGWGLDEGLVITLDFHGGTLKNDFIYTFDNGKSQYTGPTSAKRAADNEKFRAIWTQIADRFKDYSYNLLFEIINEPYFHMGEADMNTLNMDLLAIIRGSGGNNATRNIILTGGGDTSHNAPLQIAPSIISSDNYLIATFHYYQPFNFTSSSADSRDVESWGSTSDKNTLSSDFDAVSSWATANNIPVFVGEFSADNPGGYKYSTGDLREMSANTTGYADGGPDNASRVEYHRFIAEQSINRGFSFAAWDSGPMSNKTIHMRNDSPLTTNYNIANFSVNSYNPKNTNISTVVDNSIWIEDVKEALLDTSSSCNSSTSQVVINPNFECGYNNNWSKTGGGSATFSDGTGQSRSGNVSAKMVVSAAGSLNSVILKNQAFTNNLTDKVVTIKGYVKINSGTTNIKVRFKSTVNGSTSYYVSDNIPLTSNYTASPFEFQYFIDPLTTSVEFQILCGAAAKTYYFDDFEFTIEDASVLGIENIVLDNQVVIYPIPASDIVTIKTDLDIKSATIFNILGKEIKNHKNMDNNTIDVSGLEKGIYFIKFLIKDGQTLTKKISID